MESFCGFFPIFEVALKLASLVLILFQYNILVTVLKRAGEGRACVAGMVSFSTNTGVSSAISDFPAKATSPSHGVQVRHKVETAWLPESLHGGKPRRSDYPETLLLERPQARVWFTSPREQSASVISHVRAPS